jgi:hypothetical protein
MCNSTPPLLSRNNYPSHRITIVTPSRGLPRRWRYATILRMNVANLPRKLRPLTSESRVIRGNAIGGKIDGRSAEGRFLAKCVAELTAQLGVEPSFTQAMLIRRAARALLRLELLDRKASEGGWTDHDARTFGGLNNAVRLFMREIALQAKASARAQAKPPELSDYLNARASPR